MYRQAAGEVGDERVLVGWVGTMGVYIFLASFVLLLSAGEFHSCSLLGSRNEYVICMIGKLAHQSLNPHVEFSVKNRMSKGPMLGNRNRPRR